MEGQDGLSFSKLSQIPIDFRHLGFHDFHQFISHRYILNVNGFKVRGFFRVILDFSQEIRHAISHHAAGFHIAIHVQEMGGWKFLGGTKRFVQLDKTPVTGHAQYQIPTIHFPKRGLVVGIRDIRRGGNGIRVKFGYQVRSQLKFTRGDLFDPSHFQGQGLTPQNAGHLSLVIHLDCVQ